MKKCKLGIIGAGNMGMAIAQGAVLKHCLKPEEIGIYEHRVVNINKGKELGFVVYHDEIECAENSEYLMLSIKPQGFEALLKKLQEIENRPILISIAAGISIRYIHQFLPDCGVIRAMPNTPLLIGEGATALCYQRVNRSQFDFIFSLFASLGEVCEVEEKHMNTIIAVSGSTPAYVYYFIDCLAKDAAKQGMDYSLALKLATQTFIGAAKLLKTDGRSATTLIDMVCSKGGTTIEAMNVLQSEGLDELLQHANQKAIERAEALGK